MRFRSAQIYGVLSQGPSLESPFWDDFEFGGNAASGVAAITNATTFGQGQWRCATSLGGVIQAVTTDQDANTHGVIEMVTTGNAASAAAFCRFAAGVPTKTIGNTFRFFHRHRVRNIPILSNGTTRYVYNGGLLSSASTAPTDGIMWTYSDNVNGGAWQLQALKASAPTVINSAVAVAINTPYILDIIWDGIAARGFINGVSAGGPIAAANMPLVAVGECYQKLNSVGTGTTQVRLDYHWFDPTWGSPRS